ncbi:MAG: aldo/keto reductase [Chloroflexi bacterium]|nr:aldo/keto reductase [Chloroflexota bacterium]
MSDSDLIHWLLAASTPSIRYLTLRSLLTRPAGDPEVEAAHQAIMTEGPIPAILAGQADEGNWAGERGYYTPKYTSTHWSMLLLAELNADGADSRLRRGAAFMLAATQGELKQAITRGAHGLSCFWGNLLRYALHCGQADDPRVHAIVNYLAHDAQEAGWRCSYNGELPCAWGAARALWGLAALPARPRFPQAEAAIHRTASSGRVGGPGLPRCPSSPGVAGLPAQTRRPLAGQQPFQATHLAGASESGRNRPLGFSAGGDHTPTSEGGTGVQTVLLGNTGLMVSRLAFGTAYMGPQSDRLSPEEGAALLLQALDLGISFWDTSDDYGSHPHVAHALRQIPREQVVIASKTYEPAGAADRILAELGTDYLDILLVHCVGLSWVDAARECLRLWQQDKAQGRVRALGFSTHSAGVARLAAEWPEVEMLLVPIMADGERGRGHESDGLRHTGCRPGGGLLLCLPASLHSQPVHRHAQPQRCAG